MFCGAYGRNIIGGFLSVLKVQTEVITKAFLQVLFDWSRESLT